MEKKYYAGFDIGGCNIRAVIADGNGGFLAEPIRRKHDLSKGPIWVSDCMKEIIEEFAFNSRISLENIINAGISSAGPLDFGKFGGSIKNSTNIKFDDSYKDSNEDIYIPLVDPLKGFLKREVYLGNDVNTAVIGVVMFGEGKKYGNPKDMKYTAAVTTHGAGFGAGIWARGGVLEGVDGNAAECGHLIVVDNGMKCGCGNYGCAETFGSGTGIAKNAFAKLEKYGLNKYGSDSLVYQKASSRLEGDHTVERLVDDHTVWYELPKYIDAKLVFDAYRESNGKDKVAREVIEEAGKYIGRAYGMIACSYNPYFIATYGGVTKNWDLFEGVVLDEMKKSCNVRIPDVFVTKLGDDAGLYGAVGRAMGYGE